jgi:hypothetical protein
MILTLIVERDTWRSVQKGERNAEATEFHCDILHSDFIKHNITLHMIDGDKAVAWEIAVTDQNLFWGYMKHMTESVQTLLCLR